VDFFFFFCGFQISLKRKAAEHELVIEGWIGYPNKRLFLPGVFSIY